MDTNSRVFQKALQTLGAQDTGVEPSPVKRKANTEISKRHAKALKASTFNVEPVLMDQLSGGESCCCFFSLLAANCHYLAAMHVNAYASAVTAIIKRMRILDEMGPSSVISRGIVESEHDYRHEMAKLFNSIHSAMQQFLRVRDLYLGATDSLV